MEGLTLLPEVDVRRALAGRRLTFTVLRPAFPAIGVGALRVLRIRETADERLELVASYDRYERREDRT